MTMTRQVRRYTRMCTVLVVLAGASSATAGKDPYRIKSLKGDAYRGPDSFRVTVRYDVRIKDYDPKAEYELILYLTKEGRPLQDQEGQPLQQVVRLRQPEINKKGEARFVGQAEGDIAAGLVQNGKHLRVQATLFYVGDSRPLASKQTDLKVHKD